MHRAQFSIMNSLTEAKEFDKLKIMKNTHKDSPRRQTQTKMPGKQMCRYYGNIHPLRQCSAYRKTCTECSKICHSRAVCRSSRTRAMKEMEQEVVQDSAEENNIDSVYIISIHFNKKLLHTNGKLKNISRLK